MALHNQADVQQRGQFWSHVARAGQDRWVDGYQKFDGAHGQDRCVPAARRHMHAGCVALLVDCTLIARAHAS